MNPKNQKQKSSEKDQNIVALLSKSSSHNEGMKLLMDSYQSRLYWHIRRFVVDSDATEDILQDTFIKVYQNFHQFKQDSQLYTWLYRIATNEALQYINKQKRMQKSSQDVEKDLENLVADNASSDAEEIQVLLQKAIQSLPEKQKLVFSMRYYEEMPYEEMSQVLDMSVSTLKTNYHYAKQKVEDYIKLHFHDLD